MASWVLHRLYGERERDRETERRRETERQRETCTDCVVVPHIVRHDEYLVSDFRQSRGRIGARVLRVAAVATVPAPAITYVSHRRRETHRDRERPTERERGAYRDTERGNTRWLEQAQCQSSSRVWVRLL